MTRLKTIVGPIDSRAAIPLTSAIERATTGSHLRRAKAMGDTAYALLP
jgi:hypothetical protein